MPEPVEAQSVGEAPNVLEGTESDSQRTRTGKRKAPYPAHWEADIVLRDGGTASVRPIRPEDADAVQEMHLRQSPESIYLRFFAPMPRLSDKDLHRFTNVDHRDRVAFVVLVGEEIIGIGRYDRVTKRKAEVAFNISDRYHGRGVGSVLLEHLAAAARERGIHKFLAEVLPQNRKMVGVFRDAGYEVKHRFEDGVIEMEFSIDPTEKSMAVMAAREHRAEANSLAGLIRPHSLVLVGASDDPHAFGSVILRNLLGSGYTGRVHVVHPDVDEIQGIPTVASLEDVKGGANLALLAIPAKAVVSILRDCAKAGVRGVVVYATGFADAGDDEGRELQRTLVRTARGLGMRIIGPATLGLINTNPDFQLNTTPSPRVPAPGKLGLFSQSAALGIAVLAAAGRRGLSVSSYVNAGNRADVSANDLMQFWREDEDTEVVAMYLESSGNPRKFSRVARYLASVKPTIVVKTGQLQGAIPVGQMIRESRVADAAYQAMLRQAGVIRVDTIHQMFDVAQLLTSQPIPSGLRLGIVTNSQALSQLTMEAGKAFSLEIGMPPISLTMQSSLDEVKDTLGTVLSSPDVDMLMFCFTPRIGTDGEDVVAAVEEAAKNSEKTVAACYLGMMGDRHEGLFGGRSVPAYATPLDGINALARASFYSQWRAKGVGPLVNPEGIDEERARALVEQVLDEADPVQLAKEPLRLPADKLVELLDCYGIPYQPAELARSADEAVEIARKIGWPVTLKYANRAVRDRMHGAGFRLDIDLEAEMRDDYEDMVAAVAPEDSAAGFWVQKMAPHGTPITIRSTEDPLFGPVLSFGLHGDPTDLLGDVTHSIPPLTQADVSEMIRGVKASPRLFGYKGSPRLDVEGLEDLLARISRLADELPEVSSFEMKPVMVTETAVIPLGCRAWLSPPIGRTDDGTRRLTRW